MSSLIQDIEKAFDYRGDVTLTLKDGSTIIGFLFNRDSQPRKNEPYVDLMLTGTDDKKRFLYSQISKIELTGEDPAAGKSWEEWVAKEQTKNTVKD